MGIVVKQLDENPYAAPSGTANSRLLTYWGPQQLFSWLFRLWGVGLVALASVNAGRITPAALYLQTLACFWAIGLVVASSRKGLSIRYYFALTVAAWIPGVAQLARRLMFLGGVLTIDESYSPLAVACGLMVEFVFWQFPTTIMLWIIASESPKRVITPTQVLRELGDK
ncbi:MAG: hypothetical protein R3C53_24775 [Pirellulaceae bacterium]